MIWTETGLSAHHGIALRRGAPKALRMQRLNFYLTPNYRVFLWAIVSNKRSRKPRLVDSQEPPYMYSTVNHCNNVRKEDLLIMDIWLFQVFYHHFEMQPIDTT